jgi:hypothetical protein
MIDKNGRIFNSVQTILLIAIMLLCFSRAIFAQSNAGVGYQSHSFQYVTGVLSTSNTTTQVANTWNSEVPPKYYALSVTTTASNWQVNLEGSLDKINWSVLAITSTALGVSYVTNASPSLYFRAHAITINSSNDNITATAIGVP